MIGRLVRRGTTRRRQNGDGGDRMETEREMQKDPGAACRPDQSSQKPPMDPNPKPHRRWSLDRQAGKV